MSVKITIHRGAREIGGSCIQIESGGESIIIDAGMPLLNKDGSEFSGDPKNILPKISGMFIAGDKKPVAVLITHAHMDHYGLIGFSDSDIPVYSSEGTKRLIGISSVFSSYKSDANRIQSVEPWKPFDVGPFRVTPYLVDHSAFGAFAWLVEAEGKRIMYTGDFRGGGRKRVLFENLLKHSPKNIDALLLEGTTLERKEAQLNSEEEAELALRDLCDKTDGLAMVFSSGQNIDRIVSLFKAAKASKRELVIDVYVAHVLRMLSDLAKLPVAEWDGVRVFYPYYLTRRLAEISKENWLFPFRHKKISSDELRNDPKRFLMLLRPSMDFDVEKRLNLKGANAVWSMWAGYLEKPAYLRIQRVLKLKEVPLTQIHYGGHASKSELVKLAKALSPKKIIPIHTFQPDKYPQLFSNVHILDDAQSLII